MGLREELRQRHITFAELGRRIGRHEQMVSKYCRGVNPIPPEIARLISMSTGIPLVAINGKDTPLNNKRSNMYSANRERGE